MQREENEQHSFRNRVLERGIRLGSSMLDVPVLLLQDPLAPNAKVKAVNAEAAAQGVSVSVLQIYVTLAPAKTNQVNLSMPRDDSNCK
jgi:hypothetical protein